MIQVKLIGTIIYTAEVDAEQYNKDGFDLQEWGEVEFNKQTEAFTPDEYRFTECLVDNGDYKAPN